MKVYIAAPFFNQEQLDIVKRVEGVLRSYGIDFFSPRSAGTLKNMSKEDQQNTKKEIFEGNIRNMDDCTHMVACVEHKDTGTNFEIGYFYAKKKPVVLFTENIGTINVMLAEAGCICDNKSMIFDSLYGDYSAKVKSLT